MSKRRHLKNYGPVGFALVVLVVVGAFYFLQSPAKALTPEEYQELEGRLISLVRDHSPRAALDELSGRIEKDERVLRMCHPLVHAIGHEAYEKYDLVGEALAYTDDVCGSGYIHGVLESYIDEHGYSKTALHQLCGTYEPGAGQDNCYHGVGHGLMFYSGNDVPGSVRACDELSFQKARLRCSEGVFMENFASDEENHPSDYLNPEDPFTICRAQDKPYQKDTCYFYAPTYYLSVHSGAYEAVFLWCQHAEEGFVRTCIKGAASRVTKDNSRRISYVAHVCRALPRSYRGACAAGIGSYHYTQFADVQKTRALCEGLYVDLRDACKSVLP